MRMHSGGKQAVLRYLLSVLLVVFATVIREELLAHLSRHPYLTFYPAVVFASLLCGLTAGLLATVLSVLSADYFWMMPAAGHFVIHVPDDRLSGFIFLAEGLLISYATDRFRKIKMAEARAKFAEEQHLADEKLRKSEERLRLALDGGEMGMWEWEIGENSSQWNDKKYELLGLPVGEGQESPERFFRMLQAEDAPVFQRALDEALKDGSDFFQEFRITRPDGELRWLAEKARLYRDADGKPTRMIGVTYDITDHKVLEAQLRARVNELAVLMDTVPALTFIAHDPQCRRIFCGSRARELLRLPQDQKEYNVSSEKERPRHFHTTRNGKELSPEEGPLHLAAAGREVRDFEMTLLLDDGTARELLGDAVPLFGEGGTVRGAIAAFVDITELKKAKRELENAHADLERRVEERTAELRETGEALRRETEERIKALEALRERDQILFQQGRLAAIGEMINNIAHQWRQPLNNIGLIVQELPIVYQKGAFSEEYLKARVQSALDLVSHMSQTIDDFRNFFKPSHEKEPFNIMETVARTLSLIGESFQNAGIAIEVEAEGDPVLNGYPNEFSQVLLNLFLNSRDAFLEQSDKGPRIIGVRIFSEDGATVVAVADNAGGIPAEVIGKIFDPYFTTKGPDKGTGIGLSMAKNIIERHMNGSLTVKNVGEGAEFRITIGRELLKKP